ncbi:MAG TPA: tetratricopeptide repeat protein [Candidatus Acidoferrum sp.]|nr:tetratricopeptide repeat protein [Candidatus Acidoferrum sp.]
MWRLWFCFFLLTVIRTPGQIISTPLNHTVCTLRVDVTFADGGRAASGVRVQILQGLANAAPMQVVMTNSSGSAEFPGVPPGDYRVEVSGEGIQTTSSDVIHIEDGRVFMSQMITVRKTEDPSNSAGKNGLGNFVSLAELNVPEKASEELTHGAAEMQHNNWKKAAEHFNKAISIYPQYASAYYNLSVAYGKLNKPEQQRDALQKTLKINGNFAPALVSLAHLEVADHKPQPARALLDKAVLADPNNVEALALRARVDFMQGQDQQAIADAQRVHEMPHQGYATVHYTAAGALQRLNRIPEMVAQLKLFLQEDPTNPRAEYVRQTIAELQGQTH